MQHGLSLKLSDTALRDNSLWKVARFQKNDFLFVVQLLNVEFGVSGADKFRAYRG